MGGVKEALAPCSPEGNLTRPNAGAKPNGPGPARSGAPTSREPLRT